MHKTFNINALIKIPPLTLRRKIRMIKWSKQQEEKLIRVVKEVGKQWTYIQQLYFPDYKTYQLKNKYYYLEAHKKLQQKQQPMPQPVSDEKVLDYIVQKLKTILNSSE